MRLSYICPACASTSINVLANRARQCRFCNHAWTDPAPTAYDREVLVEVLVYHTRDGIKGCRCGWVEPGRSWPEHVATIYEESVTVRTTAKPESGAS